MSDDEKKGKRMMSCVVSVILLCFCLSVITFVIIRQTVSSYNDFRITENVAINLNGGKAVINEKDNLFKVGMTVKKYFYIENNSTYDVYYKLYFDNIAGGLAEVLKVAIKDGSKTLLSGTVAELTYDNTIVADDILKSKERRELQIFFIYPETAGNTTQSLELAFDFCADAVKK